MDRIDQASDLVGRDEVLSNICRHDLARAALVVDDHGRSPLQIMLVDMRGVA
jgi:hypothetical protein